MASQVDNGFTTYEFSDEELVSAATFNVLQRMYLQTNRAAAALDRAALDYDHGDPFKFVGAAKYYEGMIAAFDFLLDHDHAEEAKARWDELAARSKSAKD